MYAWNLFDYLRSLQSVARLKEEFSLHKPHEGSSPDVSTLSLPQETFSTASQTDLSGEVIINPSYIKNVYKG